MKHRWVGYRLVSWGCYTGVESTDHSHHLDFGGICIVEQLLVVVIETPYL